MIDDNSKFNIQHSTLSVSGFTLIELIMVIVILGLLVTTVSLKWPTGMGDEAAVKDFTRAVRFAQHTAMTRNFITPGQAWGIAIGANTFRIQRADGTTTDDPIEVPGREDPTGTRQYPLIDNATITAVEAASVYFNGFGEPIDTATGLALAAKRTFLIGAPLSAVTICPETGYALRGATCP